MATCHPRWRDGRSCLPRTLDRAPRGSGWSNTDLGDCGFLDYQPRPEQLGYRRLTLRVIRPEGNYLASFEYFGGRALPPPSNSGWSRDTNPAPTVASAKLPASIARG